MRQQVKEEEEGRRKKGRRTRGKGEGEWRCQGLRFFNDEVKTMLPFREGRPLAPDRLIQYSSVLCCSDGACTVTAQ